MIGMKSCREGKVDVSRDRPSYICSPKVTLDMGLQIKSCTGCPRDASRAMPRPRLSSLQYVSNYRRLLTHSRHHTSVSTSNDPINATVPASLPARWPTDLKQRIGKCMSFGLRKEQLDDAGNILRIVARDWRELVAGSEGFLTGSGRAGFEGREVEWGEMVSIAAVYRACHGVRRLYRNRWLMPCAWRHSRILW